MNYIPYEDLLIRNITNSQYKFIKLRKLLMKNKDIVLLYKGGFIYTEDRSSVKS